MVRLRSRVCLTMADPQLPTDVLIEVLIRLPVKSILKFRCVSKTWRDLISSPVFVHRHLKYGRKQRVLLVKRYLLPHDGPNKIRPFPNLPYPFLSDLDISSCSPSHTLNHSLPTQKEGEIFSFHDPDFPELLVSPNLSIPILNDLKIRSDSCSSIPIHGPCNGLVCITLGKNVILCNPALREFKLLPPRKIPGCYTADPMGNGFGFDPIAGVYKVIQIWEILPDEFYDYEDLSYTMVKCDISIDMYNSASNSWKKVDAKVPDINELPGLEFFFNGAIHWYAITNPNNYPCILCFDMSSEAFRQLEFHDNVCPPESDLRLMELDDSLAMVWFESDWMMGGPCDYEIKVWVMKEYGVKESWTKLFVIGPCYVICPFLFLKNGWLLCETNEGQLAACTFHGNQFKEFGFYGSRGSLSAVVYEESLISLNDIISSDYKNERD